MSQDWVTDEAQATPDHHAAGRLHDAEAFLGMFIAWFFTVLAVVRVLVWIYVRQGPAYAPGTLALWALWIAGCVAEFRFYRWMRREYHLRHHPLPPRLALMQPRWPDAAKPVVALWWLAHWVLILLLAEFIIRELGASPLRHYGDPLLVVRWALKVAIVAGAAYASNVFLLLTVGAVRPGWGAIHLLWRWRFGLDFLIAVALLALSTVSAN
jgi:hypothetical protein